MKKKNERALVQLARICGVQLDYFNIRGERVRGQPEALIAVLRALEVPIERVKDAPEALRGRRLEHWRRLVSPVSVAWNGVPRPMLLRLPRRLAEARWPLELLREYGAVFQWEGSLAERPLPRAVEVVGEPFVVRTVQIPGELPIGYHRLIVEVGDQRGEVLVISAPERCWAPEEGSRANPWGVFVPLYALRTERDWGVGDLTDFEALADWVHGLGGGLVGSLPMLAAFLGEPHEPSPYAPASRLFWNELYVDPGRVPEFQDCPAARERVESDGFQQALAELRAHDQVDYRAVMGQKREVLAMLAERFFEAPAGERAAAYFRFVQRQPMIEDYARFRAVTDRLGRSWHTWPGPLREGWIRPGDYDEADRRYHLYAQFVAAEQLEGLGRRLADQGHGLYLDIPLGAGSDSYDVWRERRLFVRGASAGSPPDNFFALGQDWGFPPMHPGRMREQGYRYEIESIRQLMKGAGMLRIDHVMQLQRLFWVPWGMKPTEGLYVRYPAEERLALISLESHRNQTAVVGEDLGTVPPSMRARMTRHGLRRMYVMQFTFNPDPHGAVTAPQPTMVASLNSHDTPTFRAFWDGLDLADRQELGLLDEKGVARERVNRSRLKWAMTQWFVEKGLLEHGKEADPWQVMAACYRFLASSEAAAILVNLEDLWLEPKPQNMPGTGPERPNWRRRAAWTLDRIKGDEGFNDFLREIDRRRGGR